MLGVSTLSGIVLLAVTEAFCPAAAFVLFVAGVAFLLGVVVGYWDSRQQTLRGEAELRD